MPAFSGWAPRLQRMIPVLEPRKGGKCIPKSTPLRPRGGMWEAGHGNAMGRGSAQPRVLNHLTAKPQSTVMAPNQRDCNQLEASCIQQRRLKHAICKMHVKINNNNSMGGAEWEHRRSNPCCWQTGRLSLTQGWPRGSVTQEPEAGLEDKSRAQEPSRGQHQSTNQSLLILIFPHVF